LYVVLCKLYFVFIYVQYILKVKKKY
jgi:hypothetical protein